MVVAKGVDTRFKAVEVANVVETIAASGTALIGDVGRVGTVGAIEHLGSIANVKFDQGAIQDPGRYMFGYASPGTALMVKVNAASKLETVSTIESGTVNVSNIPSDYMKSEDDYDFQSYDLNTARASPGSTLGQAGESLTVFELSGSCSLRFNGTAKAAILVNELTYPQMVVFEHTYTGVYLQNTSQSGKTLKLYFGKRT